MCFLLILRPQTAKTNMAANVQFLYPSASSTELCAGMEQSQPLLEGINEDERLLLAHMHRPIHEAYMLQVV